MIILHDYWRSSASYRVRIALGLARLEWKSVQVDLLSGANRAPDHLARNPQAFVPAIEIDGQLMTQSVAIIEYLDETRALGLLPGDPLARARVRAMAHVIAMDIHPVCNLSVAKHAVEHSGGTLTMQDWMQHFISRGLRAFETMVTGDDVCHGTSVTLADICLMPQIYNAHRWGVDLTDMPRIRRIETHLETLPAFSAAHPDAGRT